MPTRFLGQGLQVSAIGPVLRRNRFEIHGGRHDARSLGRRTWE